MKCFKCNINLIECKSSFGYYHKCPKCGKTFETAGQTAYNNKYIRKNNSKST